MTFVLLGAALSPIAPPSPSPAGSPAADIRDIVPPQPLFLGSPLFWLILGVLCLLLAAWVFWHYYLGPRLRRPARQLSPRERADRQLDDLEGQLEAMDARIFGGAVCDVLRTYIGAQYSLHPERQTSPEFLESIAGSHVFSVSEHSLLAEFLDRCDLLKFARLEASLDAKRRLLAQAREFVRTTSAVPEPEPVAAGHA